MAPLEKLLLAAVEGDASLVAFPTKALFQLEDVRLYNLNIPVTPAAVTFPETSQQVAAIIKCAAAANLKVQARSGGHSYANYGLGGVDGAVVIDMKNFRQFSMDESTWIATIGPGTLLGEVTTKLQAAGGRAIAHGTCPQVGLGGHATIGGLGPMSRMWGASLDHVEEVEIVLADSSIVRASPTQNQDIFFAAKGAAAGFGVVTEFKVHTHPSPAQAVRFSYSMTTGGSAAMAQTYRQWQTFVSDPNLSRRFASELIVSGAGTIVTGTFFGSEAEFHALELDSKFSLVADSVKVVFEDWLGLVGHWAEAAGIEVGGGIPATFYAKSITFAATTLLPDSAVDDLFEYIESTEKGTLLWFVIFDLQGGATNDVPMEATAFAHRDALFYLQSYGLDAGASVSDTTRGFLNGINTVIMKAIPVADLGAYPGYVDPELTNAPEAYWGSNLPRLKEIKLKRDPNDVFHNPQSVPLPVFKA